MTTAEQDPNLMIDRLVDGELTDDDLRHLLKNCDEKPSQWKTMALAFVESQVMANELKSWRFGTDGCVDRSRPVAQSPLGRWSNMFSIAAIGLLALGFGFGFGKLSNPASVVDQSPPNRVVEFSPTGSSQHDDSFQFLVSDRDGGLRQVEVPLVTDVNDLRGFGADAAFPRELIEQMERQGRQVEQHRRFVPVLLRDGRDAIVPIDNMRVKQKRYQ